MAFLSVIVPGYQVEAYAPDCLTALLAQNHLDMEILCVNDGSTDGTGPLLNAFAEKDPRVRVWHTENKGVSAARNLALSHARGEYVAFVDMDDSLPTDALERLCTQAHCADIVVGDYAWVDEAGKSRRVSLPETVTQERALHSILSGEGSYNAPWGKLYRHEFLWEHAIAFSQVVDIGEDALFNLEAFHQAGSIAKVSGPVYEYARREDSAMARARPDAYDRHVPMLDAMDAYVRKYGIKEAYFRDFLQYHAALVYAQWGETAAVRFGPLAAERLLLGVDRKKLSGKTRLLYEGMRLRFYALVYRQVMRGVDQCA